jgi:hypothetical protein
VRLRLNGMQGLLLATGCLLCVLLRALLMLLLLRRRGVKLADHVVHAAVEQLRHLRVLRDARVSEGATRGERQGRAATFTTRLQGPPEPGPC